MEGGLSPEQILRWHIEAGVDETVGETPLDRFAPPPAAGPAKTEARPAPASAVRPASSRAPHAQTSLIPPGQGAVTAAMHLAQGCNSVEELAKAVASYDGCTLKRTCQRTVFADGNLAARIMFIGEAPGRDEDEQGLPFVGASGKLLDRMLASIGLDRAKVQITNVIYWRPPGNRKPEPAEVELCLPFVQRHIELVDPALMVFLGGASAAALLGRSEGVTKLRGRWHSYSAPGLPRPIPALPTYHPAYLLRTPIHKGEAWGDFLLVRKRLDELGVRP